MTHDPLNFSLSDDGVLVAPSTWGILAVPDFLQQVEVWCARTPLPPLLVVDLCDVVELEISVFQSLLWARRRCLELGRELVLVLPQRTVFQPQDEMIVRHLFSVYDDVATDRGRLLATH